MDTESGFQFAHTLSGGGIIMQKRPSLVERGSSISAEKMEDEEPPRRGDGQEDQSARLATAGPSVRVRMNGRWPAKT